MKLGTRWWTLISLVSPLAAGLIYMLDRLGRWMVSGDSGFEMAFPWSPLVFLSTDIVLILGAIAGLVGLAKELSNDKSPATMSLVVVLALLVCCSGLVYFGPQPLNGIRVDRLEADLNEHLPDGSTWEQAEAWFASHGFKTGTIGEKSGRIVGLEAQIPNDDILDSAYIYIELYFNQERRLDRRIIYRFIISL
jgi:hypothetical protein